MILCAGIYKKKRIEFIALGTKGDKIIALKIRDVPSKPLLSNGSMNRLVNNFDRLMKLNLNERLSEIKNLVSEWSKVYRTYNVEYLQIKKRIPIASS